MNKTDIKIAILEIAKAESTDIVISDDYKAEQLIVIGLIYDEEIEIIKLIMESGFLNDKRIAEGYDELIKAVKNNRKVNVKDFHGTEKIGIKFAIKKIKDIECGE